MRFLVRATAAAMRNHEALDEADFRLAEKLARDADRLAIVAKAWYEAARPGAVADAARGRRGWTTCCCSRCGRS